LMSMLALVAAERLDAADEVLGAALDLARARGSASGFALVSWHRARVAFYRGALRDAEGEARAALDSGGLRGWYAIPATGVLMDTLIAQGRLDDAKIAYDELGLDEQLPDIRPASPMLITRAWLRHEQGEHGAALRDLDEALRRITRYNTANAVGLDACLRLVLIHRELGEDQLARRQSEQALEAARAWGTRGAIGAALRHRAAVASGSEAIELLLESVESLAVSPARLEHAHSLVALGSALRRAGKRADARARLREGLAIAERCGATPLLERACEELAASGQRLRRRDEDRDRLTPSEQRIAEMAARGASNPEIAQALFLTVKTIEGHLSNTYRKLGIAGRHELSDALARQRDAAVAVAATPVRSRGRLPA